MLKDNKCLKPMSENITWNNCWWTSIFFPIIIWYTLIFLLCVYYFAWCGWIRVKSSGNKSQQSTTNTANNNHDDVIKWKHFPLYWPFVRGIHRSPVNSPHKGQWRGALIFSVVCTWINGWVNNREVGDLRRPRAHYDVTVMMSYTYWLVR